MKRTSKQPKHATAEAQNPPPSTDGLQERIRLRAYELWQQGGCEHGRDVEHWTQAELEVSGSASEQGKPTPN